MGISGLLPLLKSIHQPTHVKEFAGQVIAVDAYVWLHRGAIACATDIAFGNHTRKYVDYAMHRVRMLKYYGVKPYLVFDGASLPSKERTEMDRQMSRDAARELAMKLHRAGKRREADEQFQKSIDITPTMASHLIKALEKEGVPYIVAPYEADAQMAYLEKKKLVSAIISEDSDLLVFGCKCLLTKLSDYGDCVAIRRERFSSSREIDLTSFSDALFRHMVIFAGCDYTPGIPNIGLRKAHMYLRRYKSADRALKFMRFEGKITIPPNFMADFERADKTFQYQRVFCPVQQKVVMWNEPVDPLPEELDYYIGRNIDPALALQIATGKVDPATNELIVDDTQIRIVGENVNGTALKISKEGQNITDFFKASPDRRRPLSEITNSAKSMASDPKPAEDTGLAEPSARGRPASPHFSKSSLEDPIAKRLRILSPSNGDCEGLDNSVIVHSRFFSAAAQASDFSELQNPKTKTHVAPEVDSAKDTQAVDVPAQYLSKSDISILEHSGGLGSQVQVSQRRDNQTEQKLDDDSQEATQRDSDDLAEASQLRKSSRSDSLAAMTPPSAGHKLRNASLLPSSFLAPTRQSIRTPPDSTTRSAKVSSSLSNSFSTISTNSSLSASSVSPSWSPFLEKSRFLHFCAPTTSEDTLKRPSTPVQRTITSFVSSSYWGSPTDTRRPVINSNGVGVFYHCKREPGQRCVPITPENSQKIGSTYCISSTQMPDSLQTMSEKRTVGAARSATVDRGKENGGQLLISRRMQTATSFQASLHRFRNENET
ncbi:hypothetical protein V1525DRAFT_380985 [Lipomyces kononenkoae]|uniref:Uncharacterized protein n=1 Tax=Lipomyces kononenkoae TaxID=34357 RepID=A0ACC3SWB7_LIPKO